MPALAFMTSLPVSTQQPAGPFPSALRGGQPSAQKPPSVSHLSRNKGPQLSPQSTGHGSAPSGLPFRASEGASTPLFPPVHPAEARCLRRSPRYWGPCTLTASETPLKCHRHEAFPHHFITTTRLGLAHPRRSCYSSPLTLNILVPYFRAYLLASSLTSKMKAFLFLKIFWLCHTAREILIP